MGCLVRYLNIRQVIIKLCLISVGKGTILGLGGSQGGFE